MMGIYPPKPRQKAYDDIEEEPAKKEPTPSSTDDQGKQLNKDLPVPAEKLKFK
jgi:hypothetical protein